MKSDLAKPLQDIGQSVSRRDPSIKTHSRYRWFVVIIFFIFMLLHQSDKLLIGLLTTPIMETFAINEVQKGAVSTGALLVGAILYPLWGYLYACYARSNLVALASFLWDSTTWLNAIAPSFNIFIVTRTASMESNLWCVQLGHQ